MAQGIAEGTLDEATDEEGGSSEGSPAAVAVHRATALLLDESRVPHSLVLEYLPWLLGSSPEESLAVLKVQCIKNM
jgi:hypothetical protein